MPASSCLLYTSHPLLRLRDSVERLGFAQTAARQPRIRDEEGHGGPRPRHHAFSVGKRIHECKKECVAVTLEFYDLQAGVLLPLLPLGAGKLRQTCRRLLPLKPSGYRAAEQASERYRQQTRLQYLIVYLHG